MEILLFSARVVHRAGKVPRSVPSTASTQDDPKYSSVDCLRTLVCVLCTTSVAVTPFQIAAPKTATIRYNIDYRVTLVTHVSFAGAQG